MSDYRGLTRNQWTGTFSPTADHPIVLDTEVRGSLRFVSGIGSDRLEDITGQRLEEGMLVYVKNGYNSGGGTTVTGDKYYQYMLGVGQTRDASTGQMPNDDANWVSSPFLSYSDLGALQDLAQALSGSFNDGDMLIYSSSQSRFIATSRTNVGVRTTLVTLDDVVGIPSTNNVLIFNGDDFEFTTPFEIVDRSDGSDDDTLDYGSF